MVYFRADLRPASFRGIDFHIVDDGVAAGRRIITHEIPGRDEPTHEDLGQTPRSFNVTAIIIGAGFVSNAQAFEDALLQEGAGSLVHPHYGELRVVAKEFQRQHSKDAIGEVAFSITFERSGATIGLAASADTARNLSLSAASLFDQAAASFSQRLKTAVPDFVLDDGVARVNDFVGLARTVMNQGGAGYAAWPVFNRLTGGIGAEVASLFRNIANLVNPAPLPVLPSAMQAQAAAPVSAVTMTRILAGAGKKNVDSTSGVVSPSRVDMGDNAAAVTDLFQQSALAAAGTAARYAEYSSKEEALQVRGQLADALVASGQRAQDAGRLADWRAINSLLVAVNEDINERLGRLPRTVKIRPATVLPSLTLANRLYGDEPSALFGRANDIAARNRIAHPGFVPVRPLEVLVDGQ